MHRTMPCKDISNRAFPLTVLYQPEICKHDILLPFIYLSVYGGCEVHANFKNEEIRTIETDGCTFNGRITIVNLNPKPIKTRTLRRYTNSFEMGKYIISRCYKAVIHFTKDKKISMITYYYYTEDVGCSQNFSVYMSQDDPYKSKIKGE